MKWRIVILILVFIFVGNLWEASGQEKEKVNLRVRFEQGDTFKIHRQIELTVEMKAQGSTKAVLVLWSDVRVLEKKAEKELQVYEIRERVTRVKADMQMQGMMGDIKVSYDTAQPDKEAEKETDDTKKEENAMEERVKKEIKENLDEFIGKEIKYILSERGDILRWIQELKGEMNEIMGNINFVGMSAPLPKETSINSTWTLPFEPALGGGTMPMAPDMSDYTCISTSLLKEVNREQDTPIAVITSKINFTEKEKKENIAQKEEELLDKFLGEEKAEEDDSPFNMEVKIKSLEGEGTLLFDLAQGRPVEYRDKLKIEVTMSSMGKYVIEYKTQTKFE